MNSTRTLTANNHRAIERAFPHGSRLTKQCPGYPPVTGCAHRSGKALLFVPDYANGSLRNAMPLAWGGVGTTFQPVE